MNKHEERAEIRGDHRGSRAGRGVDGAAQRGLVGKTMDLDATISLKRSGWRLGG